MLLSQLLKKIEYCGSFTDTEVEHITNSSFEAREHSVFVCIRGFATDGHVFAPKAYDAGCRIFVCERQPEGLPSDATVILVPDSRRALALLSCALYGEPSRSISVIGITGTKGKTTTALMIKQMLDHAGIPAGYIGSNGIQYSSKRMDSKNTTTESHILQYHLRQMANEGVRAAVIEVSSQALKLGRTLGIEFDITAFTNLSPDHIGPAEQPNFDDYMISKKKLFDEYPSRLVIANADDPSVKKMLSDCAAEKRFFSVGGRSDFTATNIDLCRTSDILGTSYICNKKDGALPCSLSVPGEFNIHNALCAIAVAKAFGLSDEQISASLSKMKIDGRFEVLTMPNGACFVIDYAHNGLSLKSVLQALRKYEPNRLVCLFGSVGCRTQVRRAQMGEVASKYADFSILTSDNPDTESPDQIIDDIARQYYDPDSYIRIPDRREAIRFAAEKSERGDIILLAGKGHERYQLINGRNKYFCEREILEDYINELTYSAK